ncbi:Phosphopentomutase [Alkalispirochaeta americana]|uniref:Phosphopentomutase n=2 Tax=Alkalispirochaeta americana TaxID=159291 RepID=A0A1N6XQJ9_9SPIO|nr:Phosphopentomutase [Alkalispirochaeta americana]
MEDVLIDRLEDMGTNTVLHVFESVPDLKLPVLEKLGLGNALGYDVSNIRKVENALWGRAKLAHFGADTFWGHQEIMGTNPLRPEYQPFSEILEEVKSVLLENGHKVDLYGKDGKILVVDDVMTVGDNLETAPGFNHNVTAALDLVDFSMVTAVGRLVRSISRVSRVIAFGGLNVSMEDILGAYRNPGNLAGVGSAESGVYKNGYKVIHLGYGVDPTTQVINRFSEAGIKSALVGKVADIVDNPGGYVSSTVDTGKCMEELRYLLDEGEYEFICVNIQETDLAGHSQDPVGYAEKLKIVDDKLAGILDSLGEEDLLIVTADHGNDPLCGHSQHTREEVPLLVYAGNIASGMIGKRESLADISATAADFFGTRFPESGKSFLDKIFKGDFR